MYCPDEGQGRCFGDQAEIIPGQAKSDMFFYQGGGSTLFLTHAHTAYSFTAQILALGSLCAPVCSMFPCAQKTAICDYNVCMNNGYINIYKIYNINLFTEPNH